MSGRHKKVPRDLAVSRQTLPRCLAGKRYKDFWQLAQKCYNVVFKYEHFNYFNWQHGTSLFSYCWNSSTKNQLHGFTSWLNPDEVFN